MQFTRRGNFYQVSRITGPTHNFLAIILVTEEVASPQIEPLPGFCHHKNIPGDPCLQAGVSDFLVLLETKETGVRDNPELPEMPIFG